MAAGAPALGVNTLLPPEQVVPGVRVLRALGRLVEPPLLDKGFLAHRAELTRLRMLLLEQEHIPAEVAAALEALEVILPKQVLEILQVTLSLVETAVLV